MRHLIILLALTLTALTTVKNAEAAPLGDATLLRKLSLSLKGVPPSPAEYTELKKQPDSAARTQFLAKTLRGYLASNQYRDRMVFRLSERLQVIPPSVSKTFADKYKDQISTKYDLLGRLKNDALVDLFARLASENLSWDQLLTAKTYNLFPRPSFFGGSSVSDFGFFGLFGAQVPYDDSGAIGSDYETRPTPEASKPFTLTFDADDARIAGALTTSRFNGRYNTTGINKNRRRAAAVFRTFLCDPMVPAISSSGDRTHDFHDVAFAENYEVTENQIRSGVLASAEARHGSDAQCAACHYKLDPMGKTFQSMGVALHPEPSPGALIFKSTKTGKLVDVPVRGLGDLGKAIVQQEDYVDCQVSWFWTEFIGKDVRLTSQRKAELAQEFNRVGRKTNDFVSYLVSQPEFREKPSDASEFVTFDQVQPLLKRCDSCHAHMPDVPSFAKLPISVNGNQQEHVSWIADMTDRVNRPEGARGRMPKDADQWKSSDLDLIKKWLAQGARDENGQPTIPAAGASK
jgi:Protein of unknown function (DUF1588)